MNGGVPLDKSVARFLLQSLQSKPTKSGESQSLSERELEILKLLAEGLVKKEIASHLNIGYSTVDTHVTHIYEKLNVTNAASAVNRAHRRRLFPSEDIES
jgi:DNA-binding NarL/FixJ family response regulator